MADAELLRELAAWAEKVRRGKRISRLTAFSPVAYTHPSAVRADAPHLSSNRRAPVLRKAKDLVAPGKHEGRLAQLVRAPALQAGGRRFESCTAHQSGTRYRNVGT